MITLPKTNKIGHPKRKLVFQPSIFRCCVRFREGIFKVLITFSGGLNLLKLLATTFDNIPPRKAFLKLGVEFPSHPFS